MNTEPEHPEGSPEAREQQAIEDLIYEIREHTHDRGGGFTFDLPVEECVSRIQTFIQKRAAHA